ncbi:MAG: polysaccharide pyruvyl transferase family protein [Bacteroides sp.]|nr:polysaccharide pyruvyl transferase family protein [Bacteroides sp.]
MKIGILTFWKTQDNYGQLLQCFATITLLKLLGHDPFLIRASNGREYNPTIKDQIFQKIRTIYRLKNSPLYLIKRIIGSVGYTLSHGKLRVHTTNRDFNNFRKNYLNATSKIYSLADLTMTPPEAEGYIVGSDQIWNTTDGIYYLSWAPDNVKKISIAASFGAVNATPDFINLISPWLKRFDLVTVREKGGIEICKKAGVDIPYLIPDPTLLIPLSDYTAIAKPPKNDQPYLFMYLLGTRTDVPWREIKKFASENGLEIKYVGSQGQEDKYPKSEPTIPEWLGLMQDAEYVITNSFHGTIFALKMQKKFMVLPIIGPAAKMNDRLTTLLHPFQLSSHIYKDSLNPLSFEIDYSSVNSQIKKQADKAIELLQSALQK